MKKGNNFYGVYVTMTLTSPTVRTPIPQGGVVQETPAQNLVTLWVVVAVVSDALGNVHQVPHHNGCVRVAARPETKRTLFVQLQVIAL